jgi:hypothetical protein
MRAFRCKGGQSDPIAQPIPVVTVPGDAGTWRKTRGRGCCLPRARRLPALALARTARSPALVWHSISPPPVPIVYPRGRTGPNRRRLTRLPDLRERLDRTRLDGSDEPTDQKVAQ